MPQTKFTQVKIELLTAFNELITLAIYKERRMIKVFDLKYLKFLQSMSKFFISYCEVRAVPYELAAVFIKLEDNASQ